MNKDAAAALIGVIPTILWIALIVGLVVVFYKPIRDNLLPRISGFQVFGVEISLATTDLDKALEARKVSVEQREHLLEPVQRRVARIKAILPGARILWVDDEPGNNLYEVRALTSLGIKIDQVTTSGQALALLSQESYDTIISDIDRFGNPSEGLDFLSAMRDQDLNRPTVFYVGQLDPGRGVPAFAFGITDRPDLLLHLILDVLERERS